MKGQPVITDAEPQTTVEGEVLSERQVQVLALVAEGLTDDEIARQLDLSAKTVGHYLDTARARLDARSRAQAVAVALRQGLLPGQEVPAQNS